MQGEYLASEYDQIGRNVDCTDYITSGDQLKVFIPPPLFYITTNSFSPFLLSFFSLFSFFFFFFSFCTDVKLSADQSKIGFVSPVAKGNKLLSTRSNIPLADGDVLLYSFPVDLDGNIISSGIYYSNNQNETKQINKQKQTNKQNTKNLMSHILITFSLESRAYSSSLLFNFTDQG